MAFERTVLMIRDITINPTLDTNLHATGDVLFTATEYNDMAPSSGNGMTLSQIIGWDTTGVYCGVTLYFFQGDSSDLTGTYTVNANPTWNTDHAKLIGIVDIQETDWIIHGSDAFVCIPEDRIKQIHFSENNEGKISVVGVCSSQVTPTSATSMSFRFIYSSKR